MDECQTYGNGGDRDGDTTIRSDRPNSRSDGPIGGPIGTSVPDPPCMHSPPKTSSGNGGHAPPPQPETTPEAETKTFWFQELFSNLPRGQNDDRARKRLSDPSGFQKNNRTVIQEEVMGKGLITPRPGPIVHVYPGQMARQIVSMISEYPY